jgi:PilZ domain
MARFPERRALVRFPVSEMTASISVRFRIGSYQANVVDFNRHGITIELSRRLPMNKPLFVDLRYPGLDSETIVATAHNCRTLNGGRGYRCGIRFRTDSHLQLDRDDVELALRTVEAQLANAPAIIT